jgi:hypothetical protein
MGYDIHIQRELEAGADMYRLKFVRPRGNSYPFPAGTLPEVLWQASFLNEEHGPIQVILDAYALEEVAELAYEEQCSGMDSCVRCQGRGWHSRTGESPFVPERVACEECKGRGLVRRVEGTVEDGSVCGDAPCGGVGAFCGAPRGEVGQEGQVGVGRA